MNGNTAPRLTTESDPTGPDLKLVPNSGKESDVFDFDDDANSKGWGDASARFAALQAEEDALLASVNEVAATAPRLFDQDDKTTGLSISTPPSPRLAAVRTTGSGAQPKPLAVAPASPGKSTPVTAHSSTKPSSPGFSYIPGRPAIVLASRAGEVRRDHITGSERKQEAAERALDTAMAGIEERAKKGAHVIAEAVTATLVHADTPPSVVDTAVARVVASELSKTIVADSRDTSPAVLAGALGSLADMADRAGVAGSHAESMAALAPADRIEIYEKMAAVITERIARTLTPDEVRTVFRAGQ